VSILDVIPPGSLVALDTVAWIYEFEANPTFGPVTQALFSDGFGKGLCRAACSLLVLGEVLVQPLARSQADLVDRYRRVIVPSPDLTVWPITRDLIEMAASLRAKYRVRMLDAIHVASAVAGHADFFVTNDEGLRRISEVPILILADYLPTSSGPASPAAP
jgi:predicted nucleic acid-binding protein